MSVQFARYLSLFGVDTIALDADQEKPDTLSFELASFVAHVAKLAEIRAVNGRGQLLNLHVGVTAELDGNALPPHCE